VKTFPRIAVQETGMISRILKLRVAALAMAATLSAPVGTIAQGGQPSVPPLVQQINNGNWLPQEEAEALRDELFYQRAVHAYMIVSTKILGPARRQSGCRTAIWISIRGHRTSRSLIPLRRLW
jgi:hypothetical protein